MSTASSTVTRLVIDYKVANFAEWKRMFDSDPMHRRASGMTGYSIARDVEDPEHLRLVMVFGSEAQASAFRDRLKPVWDVSGAQHGWLLREIDAGAT